MDRRTFLKATLVTAGSLVVAGCGDDTNDGLTDTGTTDLGGDTRVDADTGTDADAGGRTVEPGEAYFPQSVASGDPKADGVVLWTRVVEEGRESADLSLLLEVALDEDFSQLVTLDGAAELALTALASHDHCVKVKLTGLDPGTIYFYRFIYTVDGTHYASRTGRTKTAYAATDETPVHFAWASCQDYSGHYYNTYKQMAREELDFFVHLGDYIYETTADPQFQAASPERFVAFTDTAGAIVFNEGTDDEFYAAASLANYRELYQIYRSDPDLQRVHERIPMVATWDDHEFSDDCYGATATYFDGRQNERDVERRKNANQAWFEYMPVDYQEPDFEYDRTVEYPDDITIYRDVEYGANLHLVMTDLRTYRADHVVPEDAFPGTIAMTEDDLTDHLGAVPDFATPYVDIAEYAEGAYEAFLTDNAAALGIDAAQVEGLLSADYVNNLIAAFSAGGGTPDVEPIGEEALAELPRGLAFFQLGKTSGYGQLGSRYFVLRDTWGLYADWRYATSGGASETVMGDAQETWFLDKMTGSTRRWKVWGNQYCLIPRAVDLRDMGTLPAQFRQVFSLSAEDWDGVPNRRDRLIDALSEVDDVVAITGDIHAFFAGTPWVRGDRTKKLPEFVGGAISSNTYQTLLLNTANSDPELAAAGAAELAALIDRLLTDPATIPNPSMSYVNVFWHGFGVVHAHPDRLEVDFRGIDAGRVSAELTNAQLDEAFRRVRFKVDAGSRELYRDFDGTWSRWDPETATWEGQ
jgi:alkaline phosphatase D